MKNKHTPSTASFVRAFISLLIFSVSLFAPLSEGKAQKIVSSDETFLTLETPHFRVIYNAKQQKLGEHYARQLERAFEFLDRKFEINPEKTAVFINDNTDSTNGYATPLPYPHMVIYPVLPVTHEALGEGSDWSLELLVHEYTHILSFYPATGFMKALKYVFGNVVSPNILMPRWWLEGVAVYNESTVAQGGRLRSIYQEAVLRAMVEEGTIRDYDIGEINDIIPTWPSSRPYLFGSLIWSSAIDKKGETVMNDLTLRQSGRVPYFIEGPARRYLGVSYTHFYEKALSELEAHLSKQMDQLKKAPLTSQERIDFNSYISWKDPRLLMTMAPQFSPDGNYLALIATDEYLKRSVRIYAREGSSLPLRKPRPLNNVDSADEKTDEKVLDTLPAGAIQRISWFNKQNKIIYEKIDRVTSTETFSDLHVYDLKEKKNKKLTKSLRAREPHISPDDSKVVFIQLQGGKTSLAILDLETSEVTIHLTSEFDESFSQPLFWSQDEILFSHRMKNGQEVLRYFKISSREITTLHSDFAPARFPARVGEDLYFVSGKNGVFNVYKSPKMREKPQPLTHVTTSVLSYTVDPQMNSLVASTMTAQGPQIKNLADISSSAELPRIERIFQPKTTPLVAKVASTEGGPGSSESKQDLQLEAPQPYSPWRYLIPQYWIPWIGTSTAHSGVIFQATTGSFDPLQHHAYVLSGSYDSYLRRGSGQLSYLNNTMEPSVLFSSSYRNTFLVNPEDLWTSQNYNLSLLPDLFALSSLLSAQIGAFYEETEVFERRFRALGFQAVIGISDASMTLAQVIPDEGYSFLLGVRQSRDENLNTDLSQVIFSGNYFESRLLPRFHGLRFRTSGLITTTAVSSFYGRASQTYPGSSSDILMRGYRTGQFLGRTILNGSVEYQFPVLNMYRGSGTDPYFFRRLHGAIVYDHVRLDGFAYNEPLRTYQSVNTGDGFNSVGAEARLDLTIGYILPLQMVLGYYQPLERSLTKDASIFALQVRGMGLP